MIAALSAISILAAILVLILALIGLFKPFTIGPVKIFSSRKAAALTIPCAVIAWVVVIVVLAYVDTGGAIFKTDEKALAAAASSASSTAAKKADAEKSQRVAEAKAFIDTIVATAADCDSYDAKIADASQRRDMLEIYQVAKAGEAACDQAYRDIKKITVPEGLSKKNAKAMQEHVSTLSGAYLAKGYKFSLFEKVANGDSRPSTLTDLQEASESVPRRIMMVMGQIYMTFSDDGIDVSSLVPETVPVNDQKPQTTD